MNFNSKVQRLIYTKACFNQLTSKYTLLHSLVSSLPEQAERLSLPDQIQEVIQRFMSDSEQQLASYNAELSRSQQETLIGTMVRLAAYIHAYLATVMIQTFFFVFRRY